MTAKKLFDVGAGSEVPAQMPFCVSVDEVIDAEGAGPVAVDRLARVAAFSG
jgi:hypothetical protein